MILAQFIRQKALASLMRAAKATANAEYLEVMVESKRVAKLSELKEKPRFVGERSHLYAMGVFFQGPRRPSPAELERLAGDEAMYRTKWDQDSYVQRTGIGKNERY
jgi:hypothetical protein